MTIIILGVAALCGGCGNRSVIITGTVKFDDGQPLTHGAVVFQNSKSTYDAAVSADGTFRTADAAYKGLPPGSYQIFIKGTVQRTLKRTPDGAVSATRSFLFPQKYTSAATSGLTFEVKRGGERTYDIVVEREPKTIQIGKE